MIDIHFTQASSCPDGVHGTGGGRTHLLDRVTCVRCLEEMKGRLERERGRLNVQIGRLGDRILERRAAGG